MRIVILANVQWPRFGIDAGGALHAFEVASRLRVRHDVTVVVPAFVRSAVAARYPELTLAVTPVPRGIARSTIAVQLWSVGNWLAVIRTILRADAIFAASHFLGDVVPLLACGGRKVVVVHHVIEPPQRRAGPFVTNAMHYAGERFGLAFVARLATTVLTSSRLVERQLRSFGFRMPIAVTVNAPRSLPDQAPPAVWDEERCEAIYLGRLAPTKGLETLLRAWQRVVAVRSDARLTIVGGGSDAYRSELERLARELRIVDRLSFTGRVSDERKERLLRSHRIFVFPSHEEGFGIALVEAMRAGLPCVTFDLEVFRELFPRGRVAVETGNMEALADAMLLLLEDSAERERLAAQAQHLAAIYTWSRAAQITAVALGGTPAS